MEHRERICLTNRSRIVFLLHVTRIIRCVCSVAVLLALGSFAWASETSMYDISVETIDGEIHRLDRYRGSVILIVNVASRCGFTYQYETLEDLYRKYRDRGLVVLGFPSGDFLGQELDSNEEIKDFCELNYGVTFPIFSKIHVVGRRIHPLYEYLTSRETGGEFAGRISWNFNKFLVDAGGAVVDRFGSSVEPDSAEIAFAIENALDSR